MKVTLEIDTIYPEGGSLSEYRLLLEAIAALMREKRKHYEEIRADFLSGEIANFPLNEDHFKIWNKDLDTLMDVANKLEKLANIQSLKNLLHDRLN